VKTIVIALLLTVSLVEVRSQTRGSRDIEPSQPAKLSPELRAFAKSKLAFDDAESKAAVAAVVSLAAGTRTLALWFGDPSMNGMHGGSLWIVKQTGKSYSLLGPDNGDLGGNLYVVCKAVSHGYHDFRVDEEGNAAEINSIIWRFDGHAYKQYRNYVTELDKERFSRHC
jgi:hypothetical protein